MNGTFYGLLRAAAIETNSIEFHNPCYDDDLYGVIKVPTPLRPTPLLGETVHVLANNGRVHLLKNGKEQGRPYHASIPQSIAPPGLTLDDVTLEYENRTAKWRESQACAQLVRFFQTDILERPGFYVDSCVCVGVGSFTGEHPYYGDNRSMHQLGMLETILDVLRESRPFYTPSCARNPCVPSSKIRGEICRYDEFLLGCHTGRKSTVSDVFMQDPVMNSLDISFLQSRGYIVLQNPDAQNCASNASLLFAPNCEWYVIQGCFEIAHPTILVFGEVEDYLKYCGDQAPAGASREQLEEVWERQKENRAVYERVYEPFSKMCSSRSFVTNSDGWTETVHWRSVCEEKGKTGRKIKTTD